MPLAVSLMLCALLLAGAPSNNARAAYPTVAAQRFELHLWRQQFERNNSDTLARREMAQIAESLAGDGRTKLISDAMRASMRAVADAFRSRHV
jgi:hypothetical protein